ncbi:MAG: hypothetical protein JWN63_593 [Candidatus Acidoferrum typicum]|nr:hypothetical protein [Candidatus Acidoferrum typicum]
MSNKRAYRLNDDAIQAIKELQQRLRVTSRGIPGRDDPLSFDPESDAIQSAEAKIRDDGRDCRCCRLAARFGICNHKNRVSGYG